MFSDEILTYWTFNDDLGCQVVTNTDSTGQQQLCEALTFTSHQLMSANMPDISIDSRGKDEPSAHV